jgi:hypothetical protein
MARRTSRRRGPAAVHAARLLLLALAATAARRAWSADPEPTTVAGQLIIVWDDRVGDVISAGERARDAATAAATASLTKTAVAAARVSRDGGAAGSPSPAPRIDVELLADMLPGGSGSIGGGGGTAAAAAAPAARRSGSAAPSIRASLVRVTGLVGEDPYAMAAVKERLSGLSGVKYVQPVVEYRALSAPGALGPPRPPSSASRTRRLAQTAPLTVARRNGLCGAAAKAVCGFSQCCSSKGRYGPCRRVDARRHVLACAHMPRYLFLTF